MRELHPRDSAEADRVRQQAGKILASPQFVRARRSSQLLQYLVDAMLAGRQADLKEYSIATAVFERPESFDPRTDSLVRVEATRLRDRLEAYYRTAADDELEISLPAGSYVPAIRERSGGEPTGAEPGVTNATTARPRRRWHWAMLAAGAVAAMLAAAGVRRWTSHPEAIHSGALEHFSLPDEVLASPALARGNWLYYASNKVGGRMRIWRRQLGSAEAQVLTSAEWDSGDPDVSADGEWITYWSGRGRGGVYMQPAAGGEETLVAPLGRSPRFSPDGKHILFWVRDPQTQFGKVFLTTLPLDKHEPEPTATEFMDAHNPQWTPEGRVLICGTQRSNVAALEHDFWIVSPGGATPPVKTGILPQLLARGVEPHGNSGRQTSFRWSGGQLIFSAAVPGKGMRLYRVALGAASQPAAEPVELIPQDAGSQDNPAVLGDRIAFASSQFDLQVWSVPLDAKGIANGSPQRLTGNNGERHMPAVSADGARLISLSFSPPNTQIWRYDLAAGVERPVFLGPGINRIRMAPDGRRAFFRQMEGATPQRQAIREIDLDTGRTRTVCPDCGAPVAVSANAEFIVHETGNRLNRLAVVRVAGGERQMVIEHPLHAVRAGALSPDGKWIAFELDRGAEGRRIFTAPFRGLQPVPESEWIAVTGQESSSFSPAWSPDGKSIYLFSVHNSARDLWVQPLNAARQPLGPAKLVYRFPNSALTPLTHHLRDPLYISLNVAPGRAVLTLSEMLGSIWIGKLFDGQ